MISLLLHYNADPNLLCNGHSALSLVIGSGNDLVSTEHKIFCLFLSPGERKLNDIC